MPIHTALRTAGRTATIVALALGLAACKGGLFGSDKTNVTPTLGNRIPILSKIEGAKVDPRLAGIAVVLPPPQANAEWAQAGGTASKSYGHLALADNLSQVWTANIAGSDPRRRLAAAPDRLSHLVRSRTGRTLVHRALETRDRQ